MAEETTMTYAKVSPEGQVIQVSESGVQPQMTQAEQAQGYSVQEVPQGTKAGDVVEVEESKQRRGGGPAFSGQESPQERTSRNLQGSQGPEVLRPDKQQPEPQPSGAQSKSGQSRSGQKDDDEQKQQELRKREQEQRQQKEREQRDREQKEREQAKAKPR